MSDIRRLLDLLDEAVGQAAASVGEDSVAATAELARSARKRVGYLGSSVVVALAGGTGSGKSSLLNAIAGEYVAEVAAIRPTTSEPLAWIPQVPEPGVVRLLDDMGVNRRVGHTKERPIVIIDMPDTDSVVGAHRAVFEKLLPRVDAVWWVVDPEKYSDRLLHRDFLGPLAAYQGQFLFIFNQVDRLDPAQLASVVADFAGRLREIGIDDPVIIPVAANPVGGGGPIGMDALMDSLAQLDDAKKAVTAKTLVDIRRAGLALAEVTGVTGEGLGFDDQWEQARSEVVSGLVGMVVADDVVEKAEAEGAAAALRAGLGPLGLFITRLRDTRVARALGLAPPGNLASDAANQWASRPGRDKALGTMEALVSELAFSAGGPYSRMLRAEFDTGRLTAAVDKTVDVALHRNADAQLDRQSWWSSVAIVKWLLSIAVIAGAVWWYASPPTRGSIPWPVVLVVGGVVVGLGLSRLLDISGRHLGRVWIDTFRQHIAEDLDFQLERSLGAPLRSAIRQRAQLGALLTEIAIETERAGQSA